MLKRLFFQFTITGLAMGASTSNVFAISMNDLEIIPREEMKVCPLVGTRYQEILN